MNIKLTERDVLQFLKRLNAIINAKNFNLDDIVKEASLLLNSKGRFSMVHRPDRLLEIIDTFRKYHIEPKRIQFVYPKLNS